MGSPRSVRVGLLTLAAGLLQEGAAMAADGRQVFRAGPDLGFPFSTAVRSGDLVYASGVMATDEKGRVVAGDIREQTRRTLDNLAASFAAAGTPLQRAASINVYLARADDFAAMNEVYRAYFRQDPPARTTVVTGLVLPGALVEMAGVAVAPGAERVVVHPPGWAPSANPYSYGIRTGDTLFLAGLVSRRGADGANVPGDIAAQTRVVLDNAGAILEAAGMARADVVSSRVYVTDTADFAAMNEAYRAYFAKDPPARATVKAALMNPGLRVEITLVAVKGASRRVFTTPKADGSRGTPNPNLSSAVQAGRRLYLSGMLGNTDANRGDTRAQARETLARIGRTLAAAGYGWADVVDGVVYLTRGEDFAAMNAAYREVFEGDFPARATVVTPLVHPDGLVEIMFVASK